MQVMGWITRRSDRGGGALRALALALLVAGAPPDAAFAQRALHQLRIGEKIGQQSRYRLSFDMRMRAEYTVEGEPVAPAQDWIDLARSGMGLRSSVVYEQKLVEVADDGTRAFEVRWHDYQFSGRVGEREIDPPRSQLELVTLLLSQSARFRTTPSGRTIDVTHSDPRIARLAAGWQPLEGGVPTSLPEQPVAIGDRWTSTAQIPVGMPTGGPASMTMELEHTLAELRDGPHGPVAVIAVKGSYSRLRGLDDLALNEPLHLEANLSGSSLFDVNQGRFVGGRYEVDMFALHAANGVELQLTGHANGELELLSAR